MDFKDVIQKRRTVRDFSNKKLNITDIKDAINDAFKAPTYNHLKEWYFILVDDIDKKVELTETEKMFDKITEELKADFKDHDPVAREMYLDAIPKQKRMIIEAPVAIIAVYKPKTKVSEVKKVYDLNGFASVWCAIENLLLSLAEKNIFGVTFIPKNTEAVKKILDIPAELEVASIIPIGFKNKNAKEIKPKKIKIDEHIRFNNWDKMR